MTTFFQPVEYSTLEELSSASIFEAVSDTTLDGRDVFGYVQGVPFFSDYVWDSVSEAYYSIPIIP